MNKKTNQLSHIIFRYFDVDSDCVSAHLIMMTMIKFFRFFFFEIFFHFSFITFQASLDAISSIYLKRITKMVQIQWLNYIHEADFGFFFFVVFIRFGQRWKQCYLPKSWLLLLVAWYLLNLNGNNYFQVSIKMVDKFHGVRCNRCNTLNRVKLVTPTFHRKSYIKWFHGLFYWWCGVVVVTP